jgi:KaiC/GvpD/RAD55 family RecA-like ATPase
MIKIKHNKALALQIPEFTCDGSLGDHLNNYDMLKFLNGYRFTAYIGKPGSGKTSLLVSFLTGKKDRKVFRNVFDHILLIMPKSSRDSMKKNIFKKHDEDKMFDELDYGTISTIHERLLKSSSENENTLLILDDVGASLKNNEIQKILRNIIYNRRHLKVHIVILLQSFISCPLEVRKLLNNIFMFKPSKMEFENLFNELFETKKELALDIMNVAYNKPHQYLMLNVDTQRMFRGFDEIVVESDDLEK